MAVVVFLVLAILRSTSSTAGTGFIFIPAYFVAAFLGFFSWGYCIGYIKAWSAGVKKVLGFKIGLAFLLVSLVTTVFLAWLGKGLLLTSLVFEILVMKTDRELQHVLDDSFFKDDKFVLGAIAQNSSASPELLDQIAKLDNPALLQPLGSFFPLLGKNTKGLAVMRLVLTNPRVSERTIDYLATTSHLDYVLGDIAGNRKTPIKTLTLLESRKNYLIDWGLAHNLRTPPEVLAKLLDREEYFTQRTTLKILLRNPNATSEIRDRASELLKAYETKGL